MKVEARPSAGHAVLPAVPRAFPEDESYGSGTSPDLRRRTGKKSLGFFFFEVTSENWKNLEQEPPVDLRVRNMVSCGCSLNTIQFWGHSL